MTTTTRIDDMQVQVEDRLEDVEEGEAIIDGIAQPLFADIIKFGVDLAEGAKSTKARVITETGMIAARIRKIPGVARAKYSNEPWITYKAGPDSRPYDMRTRHPLAGSGQHGDQIVAHVRLKALLFDDFWADRRMLEAFAEELVRGVQEPSSRSDGCPRMS
jgi:hypothetical protein